LDTVLARVTRVTNENVLVGFDTADDAGVYKLSEECALVQTVDFFTPIVDDPHTFGAIAAANSLSDIYAMGGRPLSALSIVCYPGKGDLDDLSAILEGGSAKMAEADCAVVGGHSVNDDEIKFGYAVTGVVHPERVWTNAGARAGDVLVFTKRLGTGVIGTALKRGIAASEHVKTAVSSMLELNRTTCEVLADKQVHGCTDVTGFGLIGHGREMARASGVTLEIEVDRVQFLDGAIEYARAGALAGGLKNNREFASSDVESTRELPSEIEALLYDPQTSGGLLVALPEFDRGTPGYVIGRVTERASRPIRLV
jgi:selenide,water dikinase